MDNLYPKLKSCTQQTGPWDMLSNAQILFIVYTLPNLKDILSYCLYPSKQTGPMYIKKMDLHMQITDLTSGAYIHLYL